MEPDAIEPRGAFAVVAVTSSAGGVQALSRLLGGLPGDFPLPIVIVQHLDPRHRSVIAEILARRTNLKVRQAVEGDRLSPGVVLIAPPNHHMLIDATGAVTLTQSELVHFVRPSADLLFESVAGAYRDGAIAVVLTGTGADASMGVRAVDAVGGTVIAQDPDDAEFRGMPDATIRTGTVDFVLKLDEIAPVLLALAREGAA